MIEERIDRLIKVYKGEIDRNNQIIENHRNTLIKFLNQGLYYHIRLKAERIEQKKLENELFETFIALLEDVKTGERKVEEI